jgi:site-specific DNA-methyltransferase (adenine-specific)
MIKMVDLKQGDCLEVMSEIATGGVDLVVTDPPYGISLTPQRENGKFKNTKVLNDDNLDWLDEWVNEIYRVSKNIVCIFCGWQKVDVFKQALEKKFICKNILVWNKDWFGMGNNYRPNYELCILCCKTNLKTKSNNKSNILTYRRLSPTKMLHSCEKPVALLEDLIYELSNEGDIVLDCFMGSGSTGEAAKNLNRNFIGIELDEKYFNIAKERLKKC